MDQVYRENAKSLFDQQGDLSDPVLGKVYASYLCTLERFVDAVISDDEIPFVKCTRDGQARYDLSHLAHQFFARVPSFIEVVGKLSPRFRYSEYVDVFLEICQTMKLLGQQFDWKNPFCSPYLTYPQLGEKSAAEIFNELVVRIRSKCREGGFRRKMLARRRELDALANDYCAYVDSLFTTCARLLVIRVDLYYLKEVADSISLRDAMADFNHLIANKRGNRLFRALKGYIAKLEYGVEKGLHFHVIFFFDGSKRNTQKHSELAKMIGEYWAHTVTGGSGDYWNCNAKLESFERRGIAGIGVIEWDDQRRRTNLRERVVRYLCKSDQFVRPRLDSAIRRIRRGNWPKPIPKKLGRPRTERVE